MAQTQAAVQAELSTSAVGARILRGSTIQGTDATKQEWYVTAGLSAQRGRARWISTTAADSAATQAAAIITALNA